MAFKKYTASEVESAINAEFDWVNEFYDNVGKNGYDIPLLQTKACEVSREGGYEGGGDYMHVVFKVGNQLFRKQGSYSSWDSNEWDGDLEEVESYEETVTNYRAI